MNLLLLGVNHQTAAVELREKLACLTPDLDQAYGSAGALLTLATVDPALGGDHLATWATSAVVMVEAGKASATRIESVGEMIRQAGLAEVSGVLIGAAKPEGGYGSGRQRRTEPAGYLAESVGTPARAGSAETG